MDDVFDIREVMLEAEAEVQEIVREVMQEIALPLMMDEFKKTWAQMPDEMKERFKTERPEEYAALMDMLK